MNSIFVLSNNEAPTPKRFISERPDSHRPPRCRGVVGIWSASSITPTLPKSVRASQTGWLLQRSMSAVGATRSCV